MAQPRSTESRIKFQTPASIPLSTRSTDHNIFRIIFSRGQMTTILFVTANPFCADWDAEADQELYQVRRAIAEARYRDRIQLVEAVAAEFSELDSLLSAHKPDVLHFAVPALPERGLFFQEAERRTPPPTIDDALHKRLEPSAFAGPEGDSLTSVLRTHGPSSRLKAVILNTPFSRRAAGALSQYAGTVIGMPDIVHQDACIAFSQAFYQQLGAGGNVREAFLAGRQRVRDILPTLPFGQVEPYLIHDEYRRPPDLRLSEELPPDECKPAPVRAMFWATIATLQRFRGTLNLGKEVRQIQRKILRSPSRDSWSLTVEWAVRRTEAAEHLLAHDPVVLAISGHAGHEGVFLHGEHGRPVKIDANELCALLRAAGRGVRCVVLNGCNTVDASKTVASVSGFAIGMKGAIPDDVAIAFAEGFFMALAHNQSLVDAFELAKQAIVAETLPLRTREVHSQEDIDGGNMRWKDMPSFSIAPWFEDAAHQPFFDIIASPRRSQ